jgi:hypothetical protein
MPPQDITNDVAEVARLLRGTIAAHPYPLSPRIKSSGSAKLQPIGCYT